MVDFTYRTAVTVLRLPVRRLFDLDVRGVEHFPLRGGVVIASNHISYLDPIMLGKSVLRLRPKRRLRFLAKAELFEKQPLAWAMRNLGQIPVDRGTSAAGDSLQSARAAIADGEAVVIFPEGTISPAFVPMRPYTGIGRLALETGAPVIPVGIWGTHRSMTKYRDRDLEPHRPVTMDYGTPRVYRDGDARSVTRDIFGHVVDCVVSARARYPEVPDRDDWWGPPEWPHGRAGQWRPKLDKSMDSQEALTAVAQALETGSEA